MRIHRWATAAAVLLAATAAADEIDVRGLDCGGFATATSFMNLDETLATGHLTQLLVPQCGTVSFSGEAIATLATCSVTPDPGGGQST
jgi:hypothetical protein